MFQFYNKYNSHLLKNFQKKENIELLVFVKIEILVLYTRTCIIMELEFGYKIRDV